MRYLFLKIFAILGLINLIGYFLFPPLLWSLVILTPLFFWGLYDIFQKKRTVLRNFPILGHFRYWLELIRPEISQYFIESNSDGVPINREQRSVVYQRAKGVLDTLPFGTQMNVYASGYEWIEHSMHPLAFAHKDLRVQIGTRECQQPYSASVLNISAMSYGALSRTAVVALNKAAKLGGFAHNTGEGGISPYHLEPGGDLIWQIGTGYFGCREKDGRFSEARFQDRSQLASVKMIEIKLSQGAKPGHGGILPGVKVTSEIAEIRHVPLGEDVISPPGHTAFSTSIELLQFAQKLRELSGGKPVGIKLCIGKRQEFLDLCKAMQESGMLLDYIAVDGGEGGTGAAPLEFSNRVGSPLADGLLFVQNCLVGFGLRKSIRIISSGKITSGFLALRQLALGSDLCYSARGMMLALGCIQALRCNTNQCPTGVATQDKELYLGLDPADKAVRVANFHRHTIHALGDLLAAMGLKDLTELGPEHIQRRVSHSEMRNYREIFEFIDEGSLVGGPVPDSFKPLMSS